ncbi:MAG: hypothetical protein QXK47_06375 [Candidatus Bathyarchaeia archaeon]
MPFQFYCSGCGFCSASVEWRFYAIKPAETSKHKLSIQPIEASITRKVGEKCPKCGRRLAKKPIKIDVYPTREWKALWPEQKPL